VAKWGLPTAEHTLFTGTVPEPPGVPDRGHDVVVVVAAMVVVVCCTFGIVEAALLHAATRSPAVVMAAPQRTRRCLTP
jgi:hypothetical protein